MSKELYTEALAAKEKGDLQTAFTLFSQLVNDHPREPNYRLNLSVVAYNMAKASDPLREIAYLNAAEAVKLCPESVHYWIALGEISVNCHRFNEAIAAYEKAIEMDPTNARVLTILGFAYVRIGKSKEAMSCYERAVKLNAELGDVHFLLSCMYVGDDYNPEAQAFHGEMGFKASKPANLATESCWNAAHGFLAMGNYEKGWNYFEARLRRNTSNHGQVLPQDRFTKPLWTKQRDCRLLISHEMGFGDCFLFMRFMTYVKKRFNVEIQFECMPQLMQLVQYNLPGVNIIPYGTADESTFDYHLPMMSLPLACEITQPMWNGTYVYADPISVEAWRRKLNLSPDQLNIGLCSAGGARNYDASNYSTDKRRSLTPEQVKPITDLPINIISFQPDDLKAMGVMSFSDTAAIIELLDGVISVDTAVANLAGAMGKKTWLLNRYDTCWRWSEYLKTPWFPSVIDIRQKKSGEWDSVIEEVVGKIYDEILAKDLERRNQDAA